MQAALLFVRSPVRWAAGCLALQAAITSIWTAENLESRAGRRVEIRLLARRVARRQTPVDKQGEPEPPPNKEAAEHRRKEVHLLSSAGHRPNKHSRCTQIDPESDRSAPRIDRLNQFGRVRGAITRNQAIYGLYSREEEITVKGAVRGRTLAESFVSIG